MADHSVSDIVVQFLDRARVNGRGVTPRSVCYVLAEGAQANRVVHQGSAAGQHGNGGDPVVACLAEGHFSSRRHPVGAHAAEGRYLAMIFALRGGWMNSLNIGSSPPDLTLLGEVVHVQLPA